MLKLNILPKSIKREKNIFSIYSYLKNLLYIIFILVTCYATLFLVLLGILQIHFNDTIFQTSGVVKKAENFSKRISEINQTINNVSVIQKDSVNWIDLFTFLSQNTPNEVKLSQIKIAKDSNTIRLAGKADTREKLIEFKEALENSGFLENIEFPIKNLLEKSDITFDIGAKFTSYEFTKG